MKIKIHDGDWPIFVKERKKKKKKQKKRKKRLNRGTWWITVEQIRGSKIHVYICISGRVR